MQYPTQPFPETGTLSRNSNLRLSEVRHRIGKKRGEVYSYVMSSVVLEDGRLWQSGTGPNFQGGQITLCTCKHRMRANLRVDQWRNKWIAGFTSLACGGEHWLFYLARVKCAYESHHELWDALPLEVREVKSASINQLGDLYEPEDSDFSDRFNPSHYVAPIAGHSHRLNSCDNCWKNDIDYRRRRRLKRKPKRPSSMLVCDPCVSFLWQEPVVFTDGRWRTKKWANVSDFVDHLVEGSL